jgi:hypothetical protein
VRIEVKLKRSELHISELNVVINEVQGSRSIVGIKNGPAGLNRKGALELIGGGLFGNINHKVALDPFFHGINTVGPNPVIHKFINGILKGLKNLFIGALDLLTNHLNVTPEFLGSNHDRDSQNEN